MMRLRLSLLLLGSVTVLAACGGESSGSGDFDVDKFAGSYAGTWESTSGDSGPATIEITVQDREAGTALLVLDFDGNYLGLGDPPRHEMEMSFDEDGAGGQGEHPLFGSYDVTVSPDGEMRGEFRDVAGGVIELLTYTGQLDGTRLDADYQVERGDGSTTEATLRMTRQ